MAADGTIGELFASDDVTGRWVFATTALADELGSLIRGMRESMDSPVDIRHAMHFQRALIVRLFEARRLLFESESIPEVQEWLDSYKPWKFLNDVYKPAKTSVVDDLFAQVRHTGVHEPLLTTGELEQSLSAIRNMPARMKIRNVDGHVRLETEWGLVLEGLELFGEIDAAGWIPKLEERRRLLADLTSAWIMTSGVVLVIFTKSRDLDFEKFVDVEGDVGLRADSRGRKAK